MAAAKDAELEEAFLSDVHLSTSFLRTNKGNVGEFRVLMVLDTCICLYIFLVTIECGLVLLTRVFSVSVFLHFKNTKNKHYKKSPYSIVVKKKKMYTSVHGLSVLTVNNSIKTLN